VKEILTSKPHWVVWLGSKNSWDNNLINKKDSSIYQTYRWGNYSKIKGWRVIRLVLYENKDVACLAQVLFKKIITGVGVAWIPGGPVGSVNYWNDDLRKIIKEQTGLYLMYIRIFPMREFCNHDVKNLGGNGWFKARPTLYSGESLFYHPQLSEENRILQSSKNWRHNVRRCHKNDKNVIEVWQEPNIEEIFKLYREMEKNKQIPQQYSLLQIKYVLENYKDNCLIVKCEDRNGNLLAIRGALIFGRKGWDTFAATTNIARKNYSSYGVFWELMKQCSIRGVEWYDMGGVDKKNNKGVFDFKKGSGAIEFNYLGEWDYSRPLIFLSFFRTLVKSKNLFSKIIFSLNNKFKSSLWSKICVKRI